MIPFSEQRVKKNTGHKRHFQNNAKDEDVCFSEEADAIEKIHNLRPQDRKQKITAILGTIKNKGILSFPFNSRTPLQAT